MCTADNGTNMTLATLPSWFGTAVLGAVLATVGFVAKQLLEWLGTVRKGARERRARLVTLLSMLNATAAIFRAQAKLRDRLTDLLDQRSSAEPASHGYERSLTLAFQSMTPAERELHDLVRAYTIHGLQPLNEAILAWLAADSDFKLNRSWRTTRKALARQLGALETHLLLWRAKYLVWIPDAPEHALVYLGGEERHGVPFPTGVERTIERTLGLATTSTP